LAGFIALVKLKEYNIALKHFSYIDAIATSPNQISRNCYFMYICMQNMQNPKYHSLSKIVQTASQYCAFFKME
jgi:hypothetical protein